MTRTVTADITRFQGPEHHEVTDRVAIEEPLEIRVDFVANGERAVRSLSITMRTPGHDEELAAGFLMSEGLVRSARDIESIRACGPESGAHNGNNVVKVRLADHATMAWPNVERHFYATSSCGVCGKASLEALEVPGLCPIARDGFRFPVAAIRMLSDRLRAQQSVFEETGGLHAAALFNSAGEILAIREDVGRHNAVDKLLKRSLHLTACVALKDGAGGVACGGDIVGGPHIIFDKLPQITIAQFESEINKIAIEFFSKVTNDTAVFVTPD